MNRDSYLYTIIFIFALTAFFATVLAITQAAYLPTITQNEVTVQRAAILKVLRIIPESDLLITFNEQVIPVTIDGLSSYVVRDASDYPVGYALPINGQGLWGSIRGYLGVTATFDRLLGIEFIEQNETPGLGGRIDEPWFKEQFQDIQLRPEEKIEYGSGLDAITGATSSSNAVLHMLNETIAKFMPLKEVMTH